MSTQTDAAQSARAVERHVDPGRQRAAQPSARVETQVWTGRPSQIANLGAFVWCALLCWLVIPIFVAMWRYLLVRTMRYELTTQRFRVTSGVLARRTDDVELFRIKDSALTQTLFQRLFGLATISMATSDESSPVAVIASIPAGRARELREEIRNLVEDLRDRKRVREVDYS
ncbi:MAG: PH domain-containing protein [Gemmatimonadaceae bacterium]|nr:PH domain-containing protein [Gemmatimonadaceae bacterium]